MARVTRPGGRVGLQDQDFGVVAVTHPDPGADRPHPATESRRASTRSPTAAGGCRACCATAGLDARAPADRRLSRTRRSSRGPRRSSSGARRTRCASGSWTRRPPQRWLDGFTGARRRRRVRAHHELLRRRRREAAMTPPARRSRRLRRLAARSRSPVRSAPGDARRRSSTVPPRCGTSSGSSRSARAWRARPAASRRASYIVDELRRSRHRGSSVRGVRRRDAARPRCPMANVIAVVPGRGPRT